MSINCNFYQLVAIKDGLDKGKVVLNTLEVIDKYGLKWFWLKICAATFTLFACKNSENFQNVFRIDSIAKNLEIATQSFKTWSPELTNLYTEISQKLEQKSRKSKENRGIYLCAIQQLNSSVATQASMQQEPSSQPLIPKSFSMPTAPAPETPKAKSIELKSVTRVHLEHAEEAIMLLANQLCREITEGNESYCISPLSIMAGLSIALHSIKEDQKELFIEKLNLKGLTEGEIHAVVICILNKTQKGGFINIALALAHTGWAAIGQSFKDLIQTHYKGEVIQAQDLMSVTNEWVNKKTKGRIPAVLDSETDDPMVINSLVLDLLWEDQFDRPKEGWRIGDFHALDGIHQVEMMKLEKTFKIYRGEDFDLIALPYDGLRNGLGDARFNQYIILPKEGKSIKSIEAELTPEKIKMMRENLHQENVILELPKTQDANSYEILEILQGKLGIPFQIDTDVMPGMITQILHKTVIENNEAGTKAAAVTIHRYKCMAFEQSEFVINRSFLYFLMQDDTMIFRGAVKTKKALTPIPNGE